jgi:folate-binding protein YgfZ
MNTSQTLRGHITIHGADSDHFLQNLITNDVNLLSTAPYIHACLLTPQGKFLHDFFITHDDETYVLNCEPITRAQDLFQKLNLYKLRSNVIITHHNDRPSYLTPYGYSFDDIQNALSLHDWEMARLSQKRADGSRDAEIGTSTLSELNLEAAAVSFDKGCYIGQELTARVHHRGLTKKRLYAVEFTHAPPVFGTELPNKIGIMRSSYQNYGLALIKDEIASTLSTSDLGFLHIP